MPNRILLIDDDDSHRLLARRALKELNPQIIEARNPEEALQILKTEQAGLALVILDMNLNGISGIALLREVRATSALEILPVVVLSTSALERDVTAAYHAGASCYLIKSTDPSEFRSTLAKAAQFFLPR